MTAGQKQDASEGGFGPLFSLGPGYHFSMHPKLRCLEFQTADGPTLMATDEALIKSALAGQARLRFYTWAVPTVSLGYFQSHADLARHPRLAGLPVVRRHTGGGAIVHHHELTYALALPAGPPWHTDESWLCRFHHVVGRALRHLNITTVKPVICGEEKKLGPFLCFQHQTPGDLVAGGSKIVGSAQRRPHGAVLQHGSILLAQSEHAPELPGLRELTGIDIRAKTLADDIRSFLFAETGWPLGPSRLTAEELADVAAIRDNKYASPDWTRKR